MTMGTGYEIMRERIEAKKYANKLSWQGTGKTVDREARKAYQDESRDLKAKFEKDLAHHFQMEGHPKVGLLFEIAWEEGHSSGFSSVLEQYASLSRLMKQEDAPGELTLSFSGVLHDFDAKDPMPPKTYTESIKSWRTRRALRMAWWFIENVNESDPDRQGVFFKLREIVREAQ
jgi:hypothetical protein